MKFMHEKDYFQCFPTALGHKILFCKFDMTIDHTQVRELRMVKSVSWKDEEPPQSVCAAKFTLS